MVSEIIKNLLCAVLAWHCSVAPPPALPAPVVQPLPPAEGAPVFPEKIANDAVNQNESIVDNPDDDEGIVALADDFNDDPAATSTIVDDGLSDASATTTVITIESFASSPAIYAPKDFAPIDTVGDKSAAWLETAWINKPSRSTSAVLLSGDENISAPIENISSSSTGSTDPDATAASSSVTSIIDVNDASSTIENVTSTLPIILSHLVISAVRIGTASSTLDEFVELYNPTDSAISIGGYKLRPFTASGNIKTYLVNPFPAETSILPKGYFLIAHPNGYATNTPGQILPDMVYTGDTSIASSNSIVLFDAQGGIIDQLGFGEATIFEGAPALNLDNDGLVLVRALGIDTDNNSADFSIEEYTPHSAVGG